MKCLVKIIDKVGGFDVEIKLENLSAIQMSSLCKSFNYYISYVDNNEERYGSPKAEKELPELVLKEYNKVFREATNESDSTT